MEAVLFTTNLEHIGDIIDKGLLRLAAKKRQAGLAASPPTAGATSSAFHALIAEQMRRALAVFVTRDAAVARDLVAEKDRLREEEFRATERHFRRLRDGLPETIETSALHLDVLRDLKRINAHLTTVAYPILEQTGELRGSRLRAPPAPRAAQGRRRVRRRGPRAPDSAAPSVTPRVTFRIISDAQSPWLPKRGSRSASAGVDRDREDHGVAHRAGLGGADEDAVEHPGGDADHRRGGEPGQVGARLGPDLRRRRHQVDRARARRRERPSASSSEVPTPHSEARIAARRSVAAGALAEGLADQRLGGEGETVERVGGDARGTAAAPGWRRGSRRRGRRRGRRGRSPAT